MNWIIYGIGGLVVFIVNLIAYIILEFFITVDLWDSGIDISYKEYIDLDANALCLFLGVMICNFLICLLWPLQLFIVFTFFMVYIIRYLIWKKKMREGYYE